MKSINIKELAGVLKLSVSTISKALHDSHEISDTTKRRVLRAAARFNYVPNPYASSLRSRKTNNIGVVLPEVADSFFSLAINGIEEVAQAKGYHVLIYLTHENYENEKNILKEFEGGRVDGVLMSVSRETTQSAHVKDLISNGVPLVFFDRACEDVPTMKVTTDDFESGYAAAAHLIEQGCTNIAFLNISKSLSISNQRLEGWLEALGKYRLKPDRNKVIFCTNNSKANFNLIKALLKGKNRPDGMIASVEKLTTPAYRACIALKLAIPQDVKIVSFSTVDTASLLNPSLTTITQPAFEMGKTAVTLLFKTLEKRNFNLTKENIILPSKLMIRASSGGPVKSSLSTKAYFIHEEHSE